MPTIPEILTLAVRHHQSGDLVLAEPLYRQVLQADPANAEARHLLGLLAHQAGYHAEALELIRQAIVLNPALPGAHLNLGIVHASLKQFDQAAACFAQILQFDPRNVDAHLNLGNLFLNQGKPAEASASFREALAINPHHALAHGNLGIALMGLGKFEEAAACFHEVVRLDSTNAKAHFHLAYIHQVQGRMAEAAESYKQSLRRDPNNEEGHFSLGNVLIGLRRNAEAAESYRQLLRLDPTHVQAHTYLGNALFWQGKFVEASDCFRQALRLKPHHAETLNNLGLALRDQGQLAEAAACFQQALDLDFGQGVALWNRCLLRLLQGNFAAGWPDFEQRWQLPGAVPRSFEQPRWDGSPLAGKTVLVYAELGLGDTIHFLRYLPLVKERGGTVVLECQPALVKLFTGIEGADQIVPAGKPLPRFDVQIPLLSLPALFGTSLATIPAKIPYLKAKSELVERWRVAFGSPLNESPLKVGIAWQANLSHQGQCFKSTTLDNFEPLARLENVRLFSLQVGPGATQLATATFPITDLGSGFDPNSLEDIAAAMMNLDLVVTIDTAVPHLAGALGVPVWVALPLVPCWRWQLERSDSPWYPTMRLFRQKTLHDWREVFERIAGEIRNL